jgi:hypothetical protein
MIAIEYTFARSYTIAQPNAQHAVRSEQWAEELARRLRELGGDPNSL